MTRTATMTTVTSKRKAKPIDVPSLNHDPAERKRVLNVLAQRRYRRRKKEHLQQLERSATDRGSSDTQSPTRPIPDTTAFAGKTSTHEPEIINVADPMYIDPEMSPGYFNISPGGSPSDQNYIDPGCLDPSTFAAFDASYHFPLPSLPSSPSLSGSDMLSERSSSPTSGQQSASSQSLTLSHDEVHLPMLELNLLRGAMAVAKRLQVDSLIWSLESNSPFHNSSSPSETFIHLPANLQPTAVQRCNPHHPVLDILPWPSVRDKLILVFAQPEDMRPPSARSPMALLEFVYDMEDSAEGIRIWGDNPYADENWEVGEKVFKNWWWCLDSEVLRKSNQMRMNRGASLLGPHRRVEELE